MEFACSAYFQEWLWLCCYGETIICFRCGNVGAPWKPSRALVWGTSSAAFTHTRFQEVKTPMG